MTWSFNHANKSYDKSSDHYPPRELTPEELIERAVLIDPLDLQNVILRADTAMNPATNPRLLELFARDDSWLVRSCAFNNPLTPQSTRDLIAEAGLNRYASTEEWRGWRDFGLVSPYVSDDRIARLLWWPEHYRGMRHRMLPTLLNRLPQRWPLTLDELLALVSSGDDRTHRALIKRNDLISDDVVWYAMADGASEKVAFSMQHDPNVPDVVRAYVALALQPREQRVY